MHRVLNACALSVPIRAGELAGAIPLVHKA